MKDQKRLFIITKESTGGINTFLNQMTLLDKKINIHFVFYKKSDSRYKQSIYLNKNYPSNNFFIKMIIFCKNIISTLRLLRKIKKNDRILTCDIYSLILVNLSLVLMTKKMKVFTLINTNLSQVINKKGFLINRILYLFIKILLRKVYKVIFVSKRLAEDVIKKYSLNKKSTTVIYNGIDIKQAQIESKKMNKLIEKIKNIKDFKIIFCGRLEEPKDIKTIFLSLKEINLSNVRLLILGDGSKRKFYENMVDELNLSNQVIFLGNQNNIYPFLKTADIFVFSSYWEGFGRVIIEAMALGKPVISTNSPFGPSEILDNNKFGFLVGVKDYRRIAFYINGLIKNKKLLRLYQSLSTFRAKYFSIEKMLSSYESLFATN